MNHLAHAFLASAEPASIVGNVMADYVKGRAEGPFVAGVMMHRRIDSFVDAHPMIRVSAERLPREFRRYAGIMLDVLYDHLLTERWSNLATLPLDRFAEVVYGVLLEHQEGLPEPFRSRVPRMVADRWLESYSEFSTVERVLGHLSFRLRRANPLADSAPVLRGLLPELREDFEILWPDVVRFARSLEARAAPASVF